MKEIWKPVRNWEDRYEVSNKGRVRNLISGQILVQRKTTTGYMSVAFSRASIRRQMRVHQIVAQAFLKYKGWAEKYRKRIGIVLPASWNWAKSKVVHHKDHNKQNNCLENLKVVTWSENAKIEGRERLAYQRALANRGA